MIDLYTAPTANGHRAAVILEESGLPYRVHKLDLAKGEQKTSEYLKINPVGLIPAIVDHDAPGGKPLTLAQSGAIVLYIAERIGKFIPTDPAAKAKAMHWFMHACVDCAGASSSIFFATNTMPDKTPANQSFFETRLLRFLRACDSQLGSRDYLADELTVADFALYPVYAARKALVEAAGDLPNLTRWAARMAARPGVAKGITVSV